MVLGYLFVACPFFEPISRVEAGEWLHAPRLTLIDEYRGICRAGDSMEPPAAAQREICNCGYARGRCERFPADAADAVRFSMLADGRVVYVFERDHMPASHAIAGPSENGVLAAQIQAFAASHQFRK